MTNYSKSNPFQTEEEANSYFHKLFAKAYEIDIPDTLVWNGHSQKFTCDGRDFTYCAILAGHGYRHFAVWYHEDDGELQVLLEYKTTNSIDLDDESEKIEASIRSQILGVNDAFELDMAMFGRIASAVEVTEFDIYAMLPEPLAQYVDEASAEIGCPPESLAIHIIASLGACIGNRITIMPTGVTYLQMPNIWAATVAEIGGKKSPALSTGTRPLKIIQAMLDRAYDERMRAYRQAYSEWEACPGKKPSAPTEPEPCQKLIFERPTWEAMANNASIYPRGEMLLLDEIKTLFGQFKRDPNFRDYILTGWNGNDSGDKERVDRSRGARVPVFTLSLSGVNGG